MSEKSGLQKIKESKRGNIAIITFVASILTPLVLTLFKKVFPEFDISLYTPHVFGGIIVVSLVVIFGYSVEDAIEMWRTGSFERVTPNEGASDVIDIISDLVDDGEIKEE